MASQGAQLKPPLTPVDLAVRLLHMLLLLALLQASHRAFTLAQTSPDVRLVGGTSQEGRLEFYAPQSRQWAAVCGLGFTFASASVVCRNLGYSYANWTGFGMTGYGTSNLNVWIPGIQCLGTELTLTLCPRATLNSSACSRSSDVVVSCSQLSPGSSTTTITTRAAAATTTTFAASAAASPGSSLSNGATILPVIAGCTPSPSIALLDGPNAAAGRVHIRVGSTWGTVCASRGFDTSEAAVVCRQLCYDPAYARSLLPTTGTVFANSSIPIVMDSVSCTGSESSLTNCAYGTSGIASCTHRSDAIVSCVNYTLGPPAVPVPDITCNSVGAALTFAVSDTSQILPSDITLQQTAGCTLSFFITRNLILLQFSYLGCMSASFSNSSHVIYSATVVYIQRGTGNGVITRTTQYSIPVKCLLVRQSEVQGFIVPVQQTAPSVQNVGSYSVAMVMYKDTAMQVPIVTYPVNITLGDYLTVGVNLASDGRDLRLILPYCYATSSESSGTSYVLLNQKCSVDPTVQMFSINETMVAFRFQVFTFTTPSASVYVHCEALVCSSTETTGDCDRTCTLRRRRRQADTSHRAAGTYAISRGPLFLFQPALVYGRETITSSGARCGGVLRRPLLLLTFVSLAWLLPLVYRRNDLASKTALPKAV